MIPIIWDEEEGIALEFDFENGLSFTVRMTDDGAEELIVLIQNKLNERFGR